MFEDATVKETHDLIASDKVVGTDVYGPDRQRIGSIKRIMLEKRSGRAAYAVLSFGGFLGIGDDYYPLPWTSLAYDETLGGFVTNVTKAQLENAPSYPEGEDFSWTPDNGRKIYEYYHVPTYWA